MKTQIKTGDTVKIISGSQKGTEAKVVKVSPKKSLAYLENIGNRTRHQRPTQFQKGGKKEIHVGIHLSNLTLSSPGAQGVSLRKATPQGRPFSNKETPSNKKEKNQ